MTDSRTGAGGRTETTELRSKQRHRVPVSLGGRIARAGLVLPALTFLLAVFYLPLARITSNILTPAALSTANLRVAADVLSFTLWQALLSTLLTLVVGVPAAFLLGRYRFPGNVVLRVVSAIPFMLPTVVVAAAFTALLGTRGWVNVALMQALGLESPPITFVGTFGAILLAHVFYNSTIVIRIVGAALAAQDTRLEQAAHALGANGLQTWLNVTLPLLKQALLSASILVFLFDFTSFGVVLLLGAGRYSTLEVEIFVRVLRVPNLPLAALLSLIQLASTFTFLWVHGRVSRSPAHVTPPAGAYLVPPRRPAEFAFVSVTAAFLVGLFLIPLLALPLRSVWRLEPDRGQRGELRGGLTLDYYRALFENRRGSVFYVPPIEAALNSITYAVATTVLSLGLGVPAAAALSRSTPANRAANVLLTLPLGASAVTLGLGLIIAYGRWLSSPLVVPIAHTMVALPFVIRTLQPAFTLIPQRLRDAAAALGAAPFEVWKAIDWPIVSRATLAAAGFAMTISLGEFGAALLITRPDFPTVPVAIYRFLGQPGGANFGQAMAMATILMSMTASGIFVTEKLRLPGTRPVI